MVGWHIGKARRRPRRHRRHGFHRIPALRPPHPAGPGEACPKNSAADSASDLPKRRSAMDSRRERGRQSRRRNQESRAEECGGRRGGVINRRAGVVSARPGLGRTPAGLPSPRNTRKKRKEAARHCQPSWSWHGRNRPVCGLNGHRLLRTGGPLMINVRTIPRLLGLSTLAMGFAGLGNAQLPSSPTVVSTTARPPAVVSTTARPPAAFGTLDYTITTISALSFSGLTYLPAPPLSRAVAPNGTYQNFYATLDIPNGVVIDYIGLRSANDGTANIIGMTLWQVNHFGDVTGLVSIDNTPHVLFGTDRNSSPLGILYTHSDLGGVLVVDVQVVPRADVQVLGWAEVWWRRTVSPAPTDAYFDDVPTNHIFFQFIEALNAAGITQGCARYMYCPDRPITRGEMAVFLAKALGLHWAF